MDGSPPADEAVPVTVTLFPRYLANDFLSGSSPSSFAIGFSSLSSVRKKPSSRWSTQPVMEVTLAGCFFFGAGFFGAWAASGSAIRITASIQVRITQPPVLLEILPRRVEKRRCGASAVGQP